MKNKPMQLAEGGCGKQRRKKEMDKKAREEERRSGKREAEREEERTAINRRCVNPLSGRQRVGSLIRGAVGRFLFFPSGGSCGGSGVVWRRLW